MTRPETILIDVHDAHGHTPTIIAATAEPNVVTIDGAAYEVHEIPAPTRCEGCPWRSPCDGCRWQGVGTE